MQVHDPAAVEQTPERVHADNQRKRQPDRRPQRIASPYPVPETKAELGTDAESIHGLVVGGCCNEVILNRGMAEMIPDPFARDIGIGHRLDGRERFRTDDEQRRLGA